jgi:hypothetical protein
MFSVELARVIFEDREREIKHQVRLRALLATGDRAGELRAAPKPVLTPARQPVRSR